MIQTPDGNDSQYLSSLLEPAPPRAPGARPFDLCHVGLVLRAVLGVQAMLGVGLLVALPDPRSWPMAMASGTVVSLTGVLVWLLGVCLAQRPLARLATAWQWTALLVWGALCAHLGAALLALVNEEALTGSQRLGVALAGAAVAALLAGWLQLRGRAQAPADAQARLVELQSRIRPHFLFNTLNTAIALVQLDPGRAERVLEDLSELFRVALAGTEARVSLAQEIELARRYLDIEQLRFGERLRVSWQLDPRCDTAQLPPLLLQPLVENAVKHGVEPNEQGGELEISTRLKGDTVELRVSNSVGAPARTPGHGLALANVRERLRLMHDVAARLELKSGADRFRVRLVLPK
ncbi:sensor histidine kinase [Pelomonas sp. CA6]|uniref:sensor histidine kinase n=1 Tax=Pelomonas sp. CA6 TaxID=2907999 RepID=UPI002407AF97|nr:histidine kinase [Pelomonas sp. CA6]